jgi:L-2,4-diaminobutyric acid acetyltransferase
MTTDGDAECNGIPGIGISSPVIEDGVALYELAAQTQVLDVNSRYAYLLWCRDFAASTVVAKRSESGAAGAELVVGFVTGYRRPDEPTTLMVWQVAVSALARGQGLAGRMLDVLFDRVAAQGAVDHLETTITPDNEASIALFRAFAKRRNAQVRKTELFSGSLLGSSEQPEHGPENSYRIGPIAAT